MGIENVKHFGLIVVQWCNCRTMELGHIRQQQNKTYNY